MKYWVFQNNQVVGPFDREAMAQLPGFSSDSLVCPEGRKGTQMGDWQRAAVVPELSDTLLSATRVPALARAAAERGAPAATLPPEPTLRDLAVLGSLQERVGLLEGSLTRLQDEVKARDTELSKLKLELDQKGRLASELQARVGELETKAASLSGLREELAATKDELARTREEARAAAERAEAREKAIPDPSGRPSPLGAAPSPGPALGGFEPLRAPFEAPRPSFEPAPQPKGEPASLEEGIRRLPLGPEPSKPSIDPAPAPAPDPVPPMARKPQVGGMGRLGEIESAFSPAPAPVEPARESLISLGPIPSLEPKPAPAGLTDAAPKGKRDKKVFGVIAAMAALATAGVYYAGNARKKPALAPVKPVDATPLALPVPAPPAPSIDMTHAAIDFVKGYAIPGRPETVSQLLDGRYPTTGRLSPWMVEKLEDDKYQVNFWASQAEAAAPPKPVFQFDVHPRARLLQGLNEPAIALLKDGTLPSSTPAHARRVRRRRGASAGGIDAVAAVLEGLKTGQKESRRAAKRAKKTAAKAAAAPPAPPSPAASGDAATGADAQAPAKADATSDKSGEEQTLDQLLLPGFDPGHPVSKK